MDNYYKIDSLLRHLGELEGSDLYLAAEAFPAIAVNGELREVGSVALTQMHMMSIVQSILTPHQLDELTKNLEINVAFRVDTWRYRINVYQQRGTWALVARLIRPNILSVSELGLPEQINQVVMHERGIVLITGATGSGKSTTLAGMIDYRNQNSTGHIVTIEDPIEFVHDHKRCIISQREVGIDTHSFNDALKSALRQAPKVILIGEIRDAETARFAMHASDTGHLVLATLHTNSANQTIERLINLFPPEQERQVLLQLSLNLRAIICQRLLPALGIEGRVPAVEIMLNSPRIQELIQSGNIPELKTVMAKSNREGMQTFDQSIYTLVQAKKIDAETAYQFADSSNDLKLRIRGFGGMES